MEILNQDLKANENGNDDAGESQGADVEGVDDRALHCFLEAGL